jgi:hypothetical protein
MMAKTFYDLTLEPQHEEAIKPKRVQWANLSYFRYGISALGYLRYDTEEAAMARHQEIMEEHKVLGDIVLETPSGDFPLVDHVFTIQVPEDAE